MKSYEVILASMYSVCPHDHHYCLPCRAFHHYREAKDAVAKHPELDRLLREEYRSMDDFRREKAKNAATKKDGKH